ncbi:MAG TPA: DUF397 domain-containing protein [Acidimicrobiales bacterium]|nr:DUF397 domain-containing protein [Acidimicrobiales bacterium]
MTTWRKSTFSNNGSCVELADLGDGIVGVRDSKLGNTSPILRFTRTEVATWLSGTKAGEFDDFG